MAAVFAIAQLSYLKHGVCSRDICSRSALRASTRYKFVTYLRT